MRRRPGEVWRGDPAAVQAGAAIYDGNFFASRPRSGKAIVSQRSTPGGADQRPDRTSPRERAVGLRCTRTLDRAPDSLSRLDGDLERAIPRAPTRCSCAQS